MGFFIEPTVFENLPYTCRTNQEEIFGPVVTLTPFDTEEEVLMMANSTPYGLAATVWTTNLTKGT
jgi:aminomuconate-semialdehyde/2-hydroxymuconate-6-semialdehyde dehydrogenase